MAVRLTWTNNSSDHDGQRVREGEPGGTKFLIADIGPDVEELNISLPMSPVACYTVSAYSGEDEIESSETCIFTGKAIGVVLVDTSIQGGNLEYIDENGNTISGVSGSFFDGRLPWSGVSDETIDGQSMVKIPKFYYRRGPVVGGEHDGRDAWWVSPTPAPGFTVHPAFILDDVEVDQFWYGKYQGSIDGESKLASVSGVAPSTARTISQYFDDAEARNVSGVSGFRMHHIDMLSAIQWLALIEAATFDSQAHYGTGATTTTSPLGVDDPDVATATYRGIVGAWGNIWQLIDGIRHTGSDIERRDYETGDVTSGWGDTGQNRPSTSDHYPMSVRDAESIETLFIAGVFQGAVSGALIPDWNSFASSGTRYSRMGGGNSVDAEMGLWSLQSDTAESFANTDTGSRLARIV